MLFLLLRSTFFALITSSQEEKLSRREPLTSPPWLPRRSPDPVLNNSPTVSTLGMASLIGPEAVIILARPNVCQVGGGERRDMLQQREEKGALA
jgi:hypothetical protein